VNKTVSTLRVVGDDDATTVLPALSAELQLAFADVAELAREGLLAMSVAVGLRVMNEMMDAEVTDRVGPKHAKLPERTAVRHTAAAGSVVLGGRRVPVTRPRARGTDGGEVQLATYATFANDDLLTGVVMERMLAGVATRRHRAVGEPVGEKVTATATSRSAVSRRFKAATIKTLDELMARDLSDLRVAAMMIDGIIFAEQCCVVALAICADGTKVPVGLWLGDTENKTVVTNLLADLSTRGLDAAGGILFVIDGSKALAAGVRKVFGDHALIQRCSLHKRRNVTDHLARDERPFLDRKLAGAFNNPDPVAGLRAAKELARLLEDKHPDAAASLREGLDDMFTVRRLGLSERLCRTLTNTNTIESMISVARTTTRNVKRWHDGKMIKRWVAAGMLNAERSFRRVKGAKDMPTLLAALAHHVDQLTEEVHDDTALSA
jgi:transposase-like protein